MQAEAQAKEKEQSENSDFSSDEIISNDDDFIRDHYGMMHRDSLMESMSPN